MRMIDCFIDVLAYVKRLQEDIASGQQPEYEKTRTEIEKLLADKALVYASLGYRREHYEKARFAVVAYIDEQLMSSAWHAVRQWGKQLLQKNYYGTANAGQEFFERLNSLTLIDPADRDVREVYYYCLALGFCGRFFSAEDHSRLDTLRLENFELLAQGRNHPWDHPETRLTPEAYPLSASTPAARHRRFSYVPLLLGGPLIGVLLVYSLMRVEILALAQRLVALI